MSKYGRTGRYRSEYSKHGDNETRITSAWHGNRKYHFPHLSLPVNSSALRSNSFIVLGVQPHFFSSPSAQKTGHSKRNRRRINLRPFFMLCTHLFIHYYIRPHSLPIDLECLDRLRTSKSVAGNDFVPLRRTVGR